MPRSAAGSRGYQFIVGLDMNLGEALLGIKVRWGRFRELTTTTEYDLIRSHAPVQADGVTPFGVDIGLGGLGYREVALVTQALLLTSFSWRERL